jgi:hypothetical protein
MEPILPTPKATPFAGLRTALVAGAQVASARPGSALGLRLLILLLHLVAGLEAIAHRSLLARLLLGRSLRHAPPAAAHAEHVACGLIRGWILRCFPALGMRPSPAPAQDPPHPARLVRAPPIPLPATAAA